MLARISSRLPVARAIVPVSSRSVSFATLHHRNEQKTLANTQSYSRLALHQPLSNRLAHRTFTSTSAKMSKSDDQVIGEFNEYVNMSASDLEKWLKSEESESSGQAGGSGDGESVGHESGRKIVDILKRNPKKDKSKYTQEDLQHMRKVASYCKRHLSQESHLKDSKSKEELHKSKAYRSLKNWGHSMD